MIKKIVPLSIALLILANNLAFAKKLSGDIKFDYFLPYKQEAKITGEPDLGVDWKENYKKEKMNFESNLFYNLTPSLALWVGFNYFNQKRTTNQIEMDNQKIEGYEGTFYSEKELNSKIGISYDLIKNLNVSLGIGFLKKYFERNLQYQGQSDDDYTKQINYFGGNINISGLVGPLSIKLEDNLHIGNGVAKEEYPSYPTVDGKVTKSTINELSITSSMDLKILEVILSYQNKMTNSTINFNDPNGQIVLGEKNPQNILSIALKREIVKGLSLSVSGNAESESYQTSSTIGNFYSTSTSSIKPNFNFSTSVSYNF